MARYKTSFLCVSAATLLGVSACVQQLWTVTYPEENNYYSEVYNIAVDAGKNLIVQGRTITEDNSSALFVAKYDREGELLWDYSLENYTSFRESVMGTASLMVDDGSVVFSGIDLNRRESKVMKLSQEGVLLWEKTFFLDFPFVLGDFAVSGGGTHYILSTFANKVWVTAYDVQGDRLWSENIGERGSGGTGVDLPNIGGLSQRLSKNFASGHMDISDSGQLVVNLGKDLVVLNADGGLYRSISADSLGVDFFLEHSLGSDKIAVIGEGDGRATAFILNSELEVESEFVIENDLSWGGISMLNESTACLAYVSGGFSGDVTYAIGVIGDEEFEWLNEDVGQYYFYDPVAVTAHNNECYWSTVESVEAPLMNSYTYRFNSNGLLVDTVKRKDFGLASVVFEGSSVYSGGITGPYDGVEGTVATLLKHRIK